MSEKKDVLRGIKIGFTWFMSCLPLLVIITLVILGLVFSNLLILRAKNRVFSSDFDVLNQSSYVNIERADFEVTNSGIVLRGTAFTGANSNTVIFSHGIGADRYDMESYAVPFVEAGWNVVVYDLRAHGNSEGKFATYGYYEKEDLGLIIDRAREYFGESGLTGLFGVSMGGATVLEYIKDDETIDFVVTDSAFSDLKKLSLYRMEVMGLPNRVRQYVFGIGNMFTRKRAGFSIKDILPIDDISGTSVPLLIIHGGDDLFVPSYMAEDLYAARLAGGITQLYIQPGAKHVESVQVDPDTYFETVFNFIDDSRESTEKD